MIHLEFDRRNFMKVGGISAGLSTIGLTDIQGADAPACLLPNDKSVIWVWLGGAFIFCAALYLARSDTGGGKPVL